MQSQFSNWNKPVHDINQCLSLLHSEMRCLLLLSGLRQVVGSCPPLRKGVWLASALSPPHLIPDTQTAIFISCKGWRNRGWSRCKRKGELWLGWVTYALASELIPSHRFYRHAHHWGPHTCKSCTAGSAFHSLGKILPSSPCLSGGPLSAVLELVYSASEKLIVHIHSRLYVQGVQTGSWKLAMVGVFKLRKLEKCKRSELIGLFPGSWFLNIQQHTTGSTLPRWGRIMLLESPCSPDSLTGWQSRSCSLSHLCLQVILIIFCLNQLWKDFRQITR